MELQEQFISDNNLSTEQASAINNYYTNNIADLKKSWDGEANKNAEAILQGAAEAVQKSSGLDLVRGSTEKIGEYIQRLGDASISSKRQEVEKLESEWSEKIKNFKGNESLQEEFEQYKQSSEVFKQKAAQFDEWEAGDYKNKYENGVKELVSMKQNQAFQEVKPKFPDTVNEYEAKAKWDEFKNGVLSKYTIEFDENHKPIAVDKDNQYKVLSLSDLVKEEKNITNLLTAQKTSGIGTKPSDKTIDGVPFKVSENMTPSERTQKIKEYLTGTLNLSITSTEYSKKFSELNQKLLGKTPS
jgi:hypothetical protein